MNKSKIAFLILVSALIYVMSYFHRVATSSISLDLMDSFGISASEMGILGGVTMAAYGIMQMPSGMLTDLLGGRLVLLLLNLIAGFGAIWFACSDSLTMAVAARFVTGIGLATVIPVITVLSKNCPRRVFILFTSLVMATAGIGHFISAPPMIYLSSAFGWRNAMMLFGFITIALGILSWFMIPPEGKKDMSENDARKTNIRSFLPSIKALFASRQYWIICLWFLIVEGSCFCMDTLWWVPYIVQGHGLSMSTAGYVSTVLAISLILGYPLQGWLSDGVFKARRPVLVINNIVAIAVPCVLIFLPNLGFFTLMGAIALFGAFVHTTGPATYGIAADMCDSSVAGTAMGFVNMTYAVWAFILQYLYGKAIVITQEMGWTMQSSHNAGISLVLICAIIGFVLLMLLKEPKKNQTDDN